DNARRRSSEGVREIREQIFAVLDADRDPDQRVTDAHRGAALGSHFPEDRVRHGNRNSAGVARVRRRDEYLQTVQEIEAIDFCSELERKEPAESAEELLRERV